MPQNRRKFIKSTVSASTALLLSSLDVMAIHQPNEMTQTNNFDLKILCTNWGYAGSLDAYCSKVKEEGYDGIEIWWPMEKKEQDEIFNCLKKYGLEVGFLTGRYETDYQEHLQQFKKMVYAAATNGIQRPMYINCHSGKDFFTFDQNKKFIEYTVAIAKETNIKICHETHRSRMLFAAPVARQYMEAFPELRMTFDVSHWCNVSESLLQDQKETVQMTLDRVDHVHARVGHAEGPQVSDPRAPEWQSALHAHLEWWDAIVEKKKKNNERLTILTEFGPPDYMPTIPYTHAPLADQWAINVYMMHLLRKRYQGIDK